MESLVVGLQESDSFDVRRESVVQLLQVALFSFSLGDDGRRVGRHLANGPGNAAAAAAQRGHRHLQGHAAATAATHALCPGERKREKEIRVILLLFAFFSFVYTMGAPIVISIMVLRDGKGEEVRTVQLRFNESES